MTLGLRPRHSMVSVARRMRSMPVREPKREPSVWALRRVLQSVDAVEGMRILIKKINEAPTNEDFLGSFSPDM